MNIGQTVKTIQKEFPSVTISRLRFMEREGLIILVDLKEGQGITSKKILIKL